MRFHPDGPAIPDALLEHRDDGRVVFLCGAGVSRQAGMPDFVGLTEYVIERLQPADDSDVMKAFGPWREDELDDSPGARTSLDQVFDMLHDAYGAESVNSLVAERLRRGSTGPDVKRNHDLIKLISASQQGVPQIVTTNFDRLFETGKQRPKVQAHEPPSLPRIDLGAPIAGITYLHGRLAGPDDDHHPYVLSSADFGRAYLSEAWATNFVSALIDTYTVVLVGYQAEDPPIKYLLQGLTRRDARGRSDRRGGFRLYAFDRGDPDTLKQRWDNLGAKVIAFRDYPQLWQTMYAWAKRSKDPEAWRRSVILHGGRRPTELAPHVRGQVAHVLRMAEGANLFLRSDAPPDPEWLCVLDARVRTEAPRIQRDDREGDARTFDPRSLYGLDDDPKPDSAQDAEQQDTEQENRSENMCAWLSGNHEARESLAGGTFRADDPESRPSWLDPLALWIAGSFESPVAAWWVARQREIHPVLLGKLNRHLSMSGDLSPRGRDIWNLVLDRHRNPHAGCSENDWADFRRRVETEGWSASVLRDFRRVSAPSVHFFAPHGIGASRPPVGGWEEVGIGDFGAYLVLLVVMEHEGLEVRDEVLPEVFAILCDQLLVASRLLLAIESEGFRTPTCYPPDEQGNGSPFLESRETLTFFRRLLDRMAESHGELLRSHADGWRETERFYFRKFKLYAFSKPGVYDADHVAKMLLEFGQEAFWDFEAARELLFLLRDRWKEFSAVNRKHLTDRLMSGPHKLDSWSKEAYPRNRDMMVLTYFGYLETTGIEFLPAVSKRLLDLQGRLSGWNESWIEELLDDGSFIASHADTDESPESLLNAPMKHVAAIALRAMMPGSRGDARRHPFAGLAREHPRRAILVLAAEARAGNYIPRLWDELLANLPQDLPRRIRRFFLCQLLKLPHREVAVLASPLAYWLEKHMVGTLKFDSGLGWQVYDHLVEANLSVEFDEIERDFRAVNRGLNLEGVPVIFNPHIHEYPLMRCTTALALAAEDLDTGKKEGLPDHVRRRFELLLGAPPGRSMQTVFATMRRIDSLMDVDPAWVEDWLVPMLAFGHSACESAWNGLLSKGELLSPRATRLVRPMLSKLFPHLNGIAWGRLPLMQGAELLCRMYIFRTGRPEGLGAEEMRRLLRAMSDETRIHVIDWLAKSVASQQDDGWKKLVLPFVKSAWPKERKCNNESVSKAWIHLLWRSGDAFPQAYKAIRHLLAEAEVDARERSKSLGGGSYERLVTEENWIAKRFPAETLDFMNRVTPRVPTRRSDTLGSALRNIAEADADLTSDIRYLRLLALAH